MRSSDLQMDIILRRAEQIRRRQTLLRALHADAACAASCAALLIAVLTHIPAPENAAAVGRPYGSLILWANAAGVVVGVLSFALGICVTLLCLHAYKLRETGRTHEQ